jgi:hypothetical protein
LSVSAALGPYRFSLTDEEARVAASRIGLRFGLSQRFERDYVAPLVLFALLVLFVAILAFSGLIGRRMAEAALLLGAIAFLATRFLAHRRLRRAERLGRKAVADVVANGEVHMRVDDDGLALSYPGVGAAWESRAFQRMAEAEEAAGMIYLWTPAAEAAPIVIPVRIFVEAEEARQFLAFVRARIAKP